MKSFAKSIKVCSIKTAAQRAGLTPALVRAWERRYQAVSPARSSSNRRLFSESDIVRLQLLKKAVDAGYNISQLATLPSDVILRIINANMSTSTEGSDNQFSSMDRANFYNAALNAVLQLDATGLRKSLDQASVHLTKLQLINAVIVPLCKKIGELWRRGDLKIINEHLATPVIRSVLWNLIEAPEVSPEAPRIVIATPLNHRHELGALAITVIARESGWRSSYFGSNLPADEIAAAVRITSARAVALSITFSFDQRQLVNEVKKLRHILTEDIAILIGGQGALAIFDQLKNDNVKLIGDLESFNATLDNLIRCNHNKRLESGEI